ncbi:hypothetical protein S7711_07716 [Stachybotrys chartarum IBT 7711]|uniref:Nucleotide-diphospho-sugar transferase domain-containing protein n=1 Tax=Stachybotrys chartarum (strain CBS 109288 / IBT 7711) TaxID=1280523 RepID=A0A084B7Z0_STACB|nr:hypothetical protein S7711_07716 [Stachybotrys chartarum IBT 7711]KFA56536.1 hypothetical protein S40293_01116 [Stachybotrys chartarum IBT 40293]KFA72696.1 hypothetical protein S40288_03408 [Stachybotrys chartarum IBT 40288]
MMLNHKQSRVGSLTGLLRLATQNANWRRIIIISAVCVAFGLLVSAITQHSTTIADYSKEQWQWSVGHREEKSVRLPFMWKYLQQNPQIESFVAEDGNTYELSPDAPRWNVLGKKVLILDVDSRLDTSEGTMLNPDPLNRDTMKPRSAGIMNHMLYALRHGYDYRLVRPPNYTDRHGTWVKVPVVKEALKAYDIVVFLDSDAIFRYINLPLEWLMGHWNITQNTLLALPIDIEKRGNHDHKGNTVLNTGFLIAQQSETTQEMFRRWDACPNEEEWEGCGKWKKTFAHEQRAFSEYLRYEYSTGGRITPIPCNEANGSPIPRGNCRGVFVRHYWHNKTETVVELYDQVTSTTIDTLHSLFQREKDRFFVDASHLKYPLRDGDLVL